MVRRAALGAVALAIAAALLASPSGALDRHGRRALAPACRETLPLGMATTDGASQLVTVVARTPASTVAVLTAWQRRGRCWSDALGPWFGRVGVSGVRRHKHEGDGATPIGIFGFYSTIYGNAPNPGVHLRYRRLRCGDWWDEDVASPGYNSFQQVPCDETPPFANGASEPLWESPRAYASFAVIGYNTARLPGAGSGIFLHVSLGMPTQGCVAIAHPLLDRVLDWLDPHDHPHVAIATTATIRTL
jgi:L,D-peptidoglycan transpeptidase YkuD (ErfK/YbiS/YcfS/YnhG family)